MTRDLPPRVHEKKGRLYHVHGGKWTPLGARDDPEWIRRYDDLELALVAPDLQTVAGLMATFRVLIDTGRYRKRDGKPLSPVTAKEYNRILRPSGRLARVFGHMTLDQVKPYHVGSYLDKHPKPYMANREIALLSRMFTYAIRRGGYKGFNPCQGIDRNPESPSDRYVEHWEYNVVFQRASLAQQMFMALTYLCNIRESTVLSIMVPPGSDRKAGYIKVIEKGNKPARVVLTPKVEEVIGWHVGLPGHEKANKALIRNRHGDPYTPDGWRSNWGRLMDKCIAEGVLKDRFTCHALRAKHATDRAETLFDTQLALGHFDEATTRRYIRHPLGRKIVPLDDLPPVDGEDAESGDNG